MKTIKKAYTYILLSGILTTSIWSCKKDDDSVSTPSNPTTTEELTQVFETLVQESDAPGFALSIVKNNALVFQEGFGYANIENKKPFTNSTQQHLASVSKTFVGAATVKALEQGLFTLDTEINSLLPVDVINPHQPNQPILIKHLFTHTSGILDVPELYIAENYYVLPGQNTGSEGGQLLINQLNIEQRAARSLEELLGEYLLADGDLYSNNNYATSQPGTTFSYSNIGTGLMAYIIEQTAQQPFYTYVKNHVFSPLNMGNTTYNIDEINSSELSTWYLNSQTPFPFYGCDSYVEGGVFTTNTDLGKYLLDMVNGSQQKSELLFSKNTYKDLFNNQLPTGVMDANYGENMGVFWMKQGDFVFHGGNSFGVSSHIKINTKDGWGYTIITNTDATISSSTYTELVQKIDQAIQAYTNQQ